MFYRCLSVHGRRVPLVLSPILSQVWSRVLSERWVPRSHVSGPVPSPIWGGTPGRFLLPTREFLPPNPRASPSQSNSFLSPNPRCSPNPSSSSFQPQSFPLPTLALPPQPQSSPSQSKSCFLSNPSASSYQPQSPLLISELLKCVLGHSEQPWLWTLL